MKKPIYGMIFLGLALNSVYAEDKALVDDTINELSKKEVIQDSVSRKEAAIIKIDTSAPQFKDKKIFAKLGLENTLVHRDDDEFKGTLQSIDLGLSTKVYQNVFINAGLSRNISEGEEGYQSNRIAFKLGASYDFFHYDKISLTTNLNFEKNHYNLSGLKFKGIGEIEQDTFLVGVKSLYTVNEKFSHSLGFDYGFSSDLENRAQNAKSLRNDLHYQFEYTVYFNYLDKSQFYLSMVREANTWEASDDSYKYVANLLKLGVIFAL